MSESWTSRDINPESRILLIRKTKKIDGRIDNESLRPQYYGRGCLQKIVLSSRTADGSKERSSEEQIYPNTGGVQILSSNFISDICLLFAPIYTSPIVPFLSAKIALQMVFADRE